MSKCVCVCFFQLTDDVKKEKEKEPEKAEKQEMSMLRKKGFEEEKKDSDDSDEVGVSSNQQDTINFLLVRLQLCLVLMHRKSEPTPRNSPRRSCAG